MGSIYALGDKCPPVNQPLSFGKVSNGCIEDPVLGTKFNLKKGTVEGPWCPSGIGKLLGGLFETLAALPTPPPPDLAPRSLADLVTAWSAGLLDPRPTPLLPPPPTNLPQELSTSSLPAQLPPPVPP